MFIDLSGVRSVRWSDAADRKNVLGPILALPQPSAAFCAPEKCSWTYPEFAPLVGHTLHAGRMFLELSRNSPPSGSILSNNAPGNRDGVGVLCVLPVR